MTVETAIERGRKAFHAGTKCAPALDTDFTVEACAAKDSVSDLIDLLDAWHRGWTTANLAAPVKS